MDTENPRKILVLGLDNSGKTSIVLNLIGKTNLINYLNTTPTIGAEIINYNFNQSNYNIWDLGGQEIYRKEYLAKLDEYLKGANKIVYVLDIQDIKRYDLSLDYLKSILKVILENKYKLELTIFLHKKDKNLEEINPNITTVSINNLIQKIKGIIPSKLYFEIFTSSILTVLDKSIVD